jgi:hypothetical protein
MVIGSRYTYLGHLPLIPLISTRNVVSQRLRSGKVMVAAGCGNDVPLAGDLTSESRYRASNCAVMSTKFADEERTKLLFTLVDLAEENYSWETPAVV